MADNNTDLDKLDAASNALDVVLAVSDFLCMVDRVNLGMVHASSLQQLGNILRKAVSVIGECIGDGEPGDDTLGRIGE